MTTEPARATLQQLDPLEIHGGIAFGRWRGPSPPVLPDDRRPPREVLEEVLLEALAEPPCHVLFSGGRDSSVMLAAAADVARRHRLPEPIPLTSRFPDSPTAWEDDWQEKTIRHLGLRDWVHDEVTIEFDTLGPIAKDSIRRFGVYWPSSAHNIRHHARIAGSGTILTGGGGDELFTPWALRRVPARTLLRRRPRKRMPHQLLIHQLPGTLRKRMLAGRVKAVVDAPWLRPDASRELQRRWDAEPIPTTNWRAALSSMPTSRYRELVGTAMDTLARVEGVRLIEPFYDARMVAAVANHGPIEGYQSRGRALEALFSDLLPREVLYRSTKAKFNDAIFGPAAREFSRAWDGTGVDERLVDPQALRAEWSKPRPNIRSVACLHLGWLAAHG